MEAALQPESLELMEAGLHLPEMNLVLMEVVGGDCVR